METATVEQFIESGYSVKVKKSPRFKAGSDLSSKVNLVAIDLIEECTEEECMFEFKLQGIEKSDIRRPNKLTIEIRKEIQNLKSNG